MKFSAEELEVSTMDLTTEIQVEAIEAVRDQAEAAALRVIGAKEIPSLPPFPIEPDRLAWWWRR